MYSHGVSKISCCRHEMSCSLISAAISRDQGNQNKNMYKVNNKDNRTSCLVSLLLTLNIFHIFF